MNLTAWNEVGARACRTRFHLFKVGDCYLARQGAIQFFAESLTTWTDAFCTASQAVKRPPSFIIALFSYLLKASFHNILIDYDYKKTLWFPGGLKRDLQDILKRDVDIALANSGTTPQLPPIAHQDIGSPVERMAKFGILE